jgi:hypothetical protein
MFEKTYKCRHQYVRAVQYDGTAEMALDLINEYLDLAEYYGILHINDTDGNEILEGDWILIQDGRAKAVVSDSYFASLYTEIKIDEYNENTRIKPTGEDHPCCHSNGGDMDCCSDDSILTTHDLREIDKADDESNIRV